MLSAGPLGVFYCAIAKATIPRGFSIMTHIRLGWMLVAMAALCPITFARAQPAEPFDLLIRGGSSAEGPENLGFLGEWAIGADRIVGTARPGTPGPARRVIEA